MDSLPNRINTARGAIAAAADLDALENLRVGLLGKNGLLTVALKELGALPADARKQRGAELNVFKTELSDALAARRGVLEAAATQARLAREAIDVSLPGRGAMRGSL
ncbi:protein containing Phenylalanyl-tRNA synthetase, class II, partial [mine drainage metagenome]